MKRILLLSLVLLTSCNTTATSPTYDPAIITQTSFVLYYDHYGPSGQTVNLHYNGKVCKLHDKGFIIIPGEQIELFVTTSSSSGVSRLSSATSKTAYVRLDSTSVLNSENNGPYKFLVITDEKQAQKELKDLHQDCL